MNDEELDTLKVLIQQLMANYNQVYNDLTPSLWVAACGNFGLPEVRNAILAWCSNPSTGNYAPRPAHIVALVRQERQRLEDAKPKPRAVQEKPLSQEATDACRAKASKLINEWRKEIAQRTPEDERRQALERAMKVVQRHESGEAVPFYKLEFSRDLIRKNQWRGSCLEQSP